MTTISSQSFFSKGPVQVVGNETTQQESLQKVAETPTSPLRSRLATTVAGTVGKVKGITKSIQAKETSLPSGILQTGGAVAGGTLGVVGDIVSSTPVVKDVVQSVAEPISEGVKATQNWLANNPTFQNVVTTEVADNIANVINSDPDIAKNAQAVNDIANAVLLAKGGAQAASKSVNLAKETAVKGGELVSETVESAVSSPLAKGAVDITKMAGETLARVPSRVATNVAEKQAQEAVIRYLPTPKAQVAARDGIDVVDVTTLPEVVKTPQAQKLVQVVKDFAQGKTKTDPIEVVGEPITKRVKDLDTQRKTIGAQLGEVSKNLGIVTKPELSSGVFARLIEVPGLQGLTVSPTGKLNFSKTTLTSKATAPDRKALQEAYSQATRWGDGEKAHLYRQELFEILGGKKKGRAEVTDTQEGGLDAIRSGLSDVLESKNGQYKTLSNEYRKIVQPLGDLRKLMKNIDPNSTDDILNMSAGLLARRITSAAASNPQIKQLLQNLDEAGVKGTTKESVTQLQDLYNILNKYYDIAPKTGFQNLTKEATADSLVGTIKETARDIAGKSNAVRQKALEDYLDELLTETR